jgi:hypothetical protein
MIFGKNLPSVTDKKIPPSRSVSTRGPSKSTLEQKSVEMTFISEYKLVWPEMLSYKHFEGGTVIFVTFNSRPSHLALFL